MRKVAKKYFIPHRENNYHPHILHTKRMFFYGGFFLVTKIIVLIFVFLLPLEAFLLPDVLAEQQQKIVVLTNELRAQKNLPELAIEQKLDTSAQNKAKDMATGQYFSHKSPNGKSVSTWIREAGYKYRVAGENLAMGFPSADEVVNAWIKSPTHYANLIDPDFQAIGAGLENGLYDGKETIYLAQHLASPQTQVIVDQNQAEAKTVKLVADKKISLNQEKPSLVEPAEAPVSTSTKVLAVKQELANESISFEVDNSKVFWQEQKDKTFLTVQAKIIGQVKSAVVEVSHYPIELKAVGDNLYQGEFLANDSVDNFFRVVTLPTITIIGINGEVIKSNINWASVKTISPTPIQKYLRAKSMLSSVTNIFSVSKNIYLSFLIFFALALILNIFVEIKKQHPHIILQTIGLLGLLFCFWWV